MTEPTFSDLVTRFVSTPLTPANDCDCFAVVTCGEPFVEPALLSKLDEESGVVLVSARGAAGKSRTASELSRRTGAPLWRLQLDSAVGATALGHQIGLFMETHDPLEALSAASGAIIIDSLDEARARVSGVSWSEFIGSIAEYARSGVRFALFGRERTLEDVWVLLEGFGTSVAWMEISHFDDSARRDYVDLVAATRDPEAPIDTDNYRAARDAALVALSGSVPSDYAATFVGYPPVLDAVAALLIKKANLLNVKASFETSSGPTSRMGVLADILVRLLEREQTKLAPVASDLGLDAQSIYQPSEQIRWLCHSLEGADPPDLSWLSDPVLKNRYVENIERFLADHPFRSDRRWASPVFEAYVAADRFDEGMSAERLIEIGNASGLLFDFVFSDGQSLVVDEPRFAALHASVVASESSDTSASVDVNVQVEGSAAAAPAVAYSVLRHGEPARRYDAELIPDDPEVLNLLGPLAGLSVTGAEQIRVGSRASGVILGPDLYLSARVIHIGGDSLSLGSRVTEGESPLQQVVLEARNKITLPPSLDGHPPTEAEFEIAVGGGIKLPYPWFPYVRDLQADSEAPNDRAVRFLNMLMNLSRAHGHDGERGLFIKKLEGRQSIKGEKFAAAVAVLESEHVARREGDILFIRQDWEKHRFSGKRLEGQRQLEDVISVWRPVLDAIAKVL